MTQEILEKSTQKTKPSKGYQQLKLFVAMCVLILIVPGILILARQPLPALSVLLLFPSLAYTSQLASASSRSPRFRYWFRWICLLGGIVYLGLWIAGLQGSKYFPDAVLGAIFCAVGLIYCFIVDLLTPSSHGGGTEGDGQPEDPELFAVLEGGQLPEGVHFDPLKGIFGMPASGGSFTVLVYEGKTGMEKMKVSYSVEDDLQGSHAQGTPEASPLVDGSRPE